MRQLNGKRLLFPAVSAVTLCFLSACGDGAADAKSSSDFATQAIHADYSVLVTESRDATERDYRLEARFSHNSDVLKLDGGDRLEVVNGAERYSLVENALLGRVIYTASRTFDRRNAPLNLTFTRSRSGSLDNALKSGSTWGRYRVQQADIRLQF